METQDPTTYPRLDHQTQACFDPWAEVFRVGVLDAARHFRKFGRFPAWLDSAETHPGSIVWLCDLFGIDAEMTRNKVRAKVRALEKQARELPEAEAA